MVSLSSRRSSSLSFVSLQTQDKRKNRVYSALLLCGTSCSFRVSVSLAVVAKRRVNVVSASGCAMRAFRFGAFAAHERHDACVINLLIFPETWGNATACDRVKTCAQKNGTRSEERRAPLSSDRSAAERRTEERKREKEASPRKRVVVMGGGGGGEGWCLPARCDVKDTGRLPFFLPPTGKSRQKSKNNEKKHSFLPIKKDVGWQNQTKVRVQGTFGPPHKRATVYS